MPAPVDELTGEWLARAEHDLRVAEFLLTMPDPPPESIGFHAQSSIAIPMLCRSCRWTRPDQRWRRRPAFTRSS